MESIDSGYPLVISEGRGQSHSLSLLSFHRQAKPSRRSAQIFSSSMVKWRMIGSSFEMR